MSAPGLTPELLDRLKRIAKAEGKTLEQVLNEAVQTHWVRFAARNKIQPEKW